MTDTGGTRLRKADRAGAFLPGKLILSAVLFAAGSSFVYGQPVKLTSLHAIHALTSEQASKGAPVEFQATVTYIRAYERALYVQDGDAAIYVDWPTDNLLLPGDRVLIKGKTQDGSRAAVVAENVTMLHHGSMPVPVPATFEQLIRSDYDARYVTVYGTVRDAFTVVNGSARSTMIELHTDGGDIDVAVEVDVPNLLSGLLDADVLVTGAVSGRFDGKMDQTGIVLHVNSMDGVKVLRRALASPWTQPITPMDEILAGYRISNLSRRVRVHGTLTYYQPGSTAVLQQGDKSLWLMTSAITQLQVGDVVDATGFPSLQDGLLALANAEIHDTSKSAPVAPRASTWDQLSTSQKMFDLVTVEGKVVAEMRGAARDEWVLESNGNLFSAIYKHPSSDGQDTAPSPMKHVPAGTLVQVTGVCFTNTSSPFDSRVPFDILLRSPDDIAVVAGAPWGTVANLMRLIGLLIFVMLTITVWNWMLRRRVHKQTAAITAQSEAEAAHERRTAQLEQWRSRILEDINSTRPLSEIVEHIAEMVSFILNGAPCWCEITDGPLLGHAPASKDGMRVISHEILSRSGLVLGAIYAAFDKVSAPNEKEESEALVTGSRLATLSIETRKLYADLVHRSEFDLLTDMHNRFSLERHLQELIDKARANGSTFGLIYVDLDDFKMINDLYGHHIGDLYLQEVSARMKRQLRSGDALGRLGGDEFAALVTVVRGRADVEEIAQRLERCFDAPFSMEGHVLRGAASVGIAMYPENGMTSDSLLNSADSAMYLNKNNRRSPGVMSARKHG
jgi:diguanylate cyclase (GGDEF)-like protein